MTVGKVPNRRKYNLICNLVVAFPRIQSVLKSMQKYFGKYKQISPMKMSLCTLETLADVGTTYFVVQDWGISGHLTSQVPSLQMLETPPPPHHSDN